MYREIQSVTTNQFALFTLNVGNGTPVSGTYASINWSTITPWMQVEMAASGGTIYTNMETSQLLSVPYSLFAASGNPGPQGSAGIPGATGPQGALGAQEPAGTIGPMGPGGSQNKII